MKLGIDFGTTNSAVAVIGDDGAPRILEIDGERTQRTVIHSDPAGRITYGNRAFDAYLEHDLQGRFLRSLKAFLPHDVPPTRVGRVTMSFVDIVARYLVFLAEAAERVAGEPIRDVVVGRPVRFHADPVRHERALDNLRGAIRTSGLPEPTLQLEPVAAALRFERELDADRTVLVGDFGGGTADFAVLRVGPSFQGRGEQRVLGTSGVAKAGDALDARFLDAFVVDLLGRGSSFVPRGETTARPWTSDLFRQIERLYDLHRLREPQLERFLVDLEGRTDDPVAVERMRRLVFDDLGYPMAKAIEATKRQFSERDPARFRFVEYHSERLNIDAEAEMAAFEGASEALLRAYDEATSEVLDASDVGDGDVDDVFLTGGTSQLPFVRTRFARRFGADRVRGGEAFTTVCEGLALSFAA